MAWWSKLHWVQGRGSEPRPTEDGHPKEGQGSQWCDRLPSTSPTDGRRGTGTGARSRKVETSHGSLDSRVARDTLRGALGIHPPLVRPQSFPPERGRLGPLGPGDG